MAHSPYGCQIPSMKQLIRLMLAAGSTGALLLGCSGNEDARGGPAGLVAECSDDAVVAEEWVCPESLTIECEDGGANPDFVYFTPAGDPAPDCDDLDYVLNDEGPFEVGAHEIVIRVAPEDPEGEPGDVLCETTLAVQDTEAPSGIEEPIELWPPNHKWHSISGSDCVRDRCDGADLDVTFLYATSDEIVNDKGDGNTEPDIILDCDRVQVRAERQGPSNGRVYTLGWKAVDDAGNESEGECVVVVPHDRRSIKK